jgi:hypothetical protein
VAFRELRSNAGVEESGLGINRPITAVSYRLRSRDGFELTGPIARGSALNCSLRPRSYSEHDSSVHEPRPVAPLRPLVKLSIEPWSRLPFACDRTIVTRWSSSTHESAGRHRADARNPIYLNVVRFACFPSQRLNQNGGDVGRNVKRSCLAPVNPPLMQ